MTKRIILLTISILIFIYPVALAMPNVQSPSAILMDATTGNILYEKNADVQHYPASITKILTATIAMERSNLHDVVTIGDDVPYLITSDSSAIYLIPGEKLTMEQLLYALLVESANDAAVAIAEYISGTQEDFAILMNKKAAEIGATHSHFITPNGLHDENHYVTAHDMALILKEALKFPELREMMSTVNYIIPATEKQITRYLWTKNKMLKLPNNKFFYDKIIASKTGFTSEARYTLASAAQDNNMTLISVVLNSDSSSQYQDTINMFKYGFNNFESGVLVNRGDFIENFNFDDGSEPLDIVSNDTVPYIKNIDTVDNVASSVILSENLTLPVKKGQNIGIVEYKLDNEVIGQAQLIAGNSIQSNFSIFIGKIKTILMWIIPIILIVIVSIRIFVLIYNTKVRRKKYRRSSRTKNEFPKL